MSVMSWMAAQPTLTASPVRPEPRDPRPPRRPRRLLVQRLDGSIAPIAETHADLRAAVLDTLRERGPLRIAELRQLLPERLLVSPEVAGQVGEISAALKALHASGVVQRRGVVPYTWAAEGGDDE